MSETKQLKSSEIIMNKDRKAYTFKWSLFLRLFLMAIF